MKALVEKTNGANEQDVSIIMLENDNKIAVRLMNYGANIIWEVKL